MPFDTVVVRDAHQPLCEGSLLHVVPQTKLLPVVELL
jgi:hypothetical protein